MDNFKVGDKIIGVEKEEPLIYGKIYEIKDIRNGYIYINYLNMAGQECLGGWYSHRFKLVEEAIKENAGIEINKYSRLQSIE